jgi:MFS family permease
MPTISAIAGAVTRSVRGTWEAVRPGAAGPKRQAWRVLHQRAFLGYFVGSLVSNLGTWLQNTAQVLLVYKLTHSVFDIGLVSCAQFSGSLVLGPTAAWVADRLGGRRLLIGTQLVSAAVAGGLAALQAAGRLNEPLLVLGALGLGVAFTFALPIQTALLPRLVKAGDTDAAMTMNSLSYNAGRLAAPALCVAVILSIGYSWAFTLNALSFVIFAVTLATSRLHAPRSSKPARVRDGLAIAVWNRRILLLLAMVAAVTLADDPILVLGPAQAHRVGAASNWAGYFLSALGAGTLLGALRPTRDISGWGASRTSRRAASSLIFLAAGMMVFALSRSPLVCLAAAVVAGMAALRAGVATQTQLLRQQPQATASVMALWAIAWAGTKPLASLIDGALAGWAGIGWTCLVLAAPALLLGVGELVCPGSVRDWCKHLHGRFERVLPAPPDYAPAPQSPLMSADLGRMAGPREIAAGVPAGALINLSGQSDHFGEDARLLPTGIQG